MDFSSPLKYLRKTVTLKKSQTFFYRFRVIYLLPAPTLNLTLSKGPIVTKNYRVECTDDKPVAVSVILVNESLSHCKFLDVMERRRKAKYKLI